MKKQLSVLLLSAFLAVGISSCNNDNSNPTASVSATATATSTAKAPSPKQVRIASISVAIDYAPYLVAKNKGWFEEALKAKGISVDYTTFQSLPPANESLATKKVDVVFAAEPPALIAEAAGIDVVVPYLSATLTQEILVGADSPIKTAADLKGKKIAVLAGSSSHYGLLKIVEAGGLKAEDIQVIDMIPPDARIAFATQKVDAWAVWPPFVQQEEISGKGRVLPKADAVIHSMMIVRDSFAKENPELTKDLVAVLEKSKKWIQENPAEAQQIVAKELGIPVAVVQKAWASHNWAAQITPAVTADIQAKSDFMKKNNFIRNTVDVKKDLLDTSFASSTQSTKPAK